jgi:hypothetical protein
VTVSNVSGGAAVVAPTANGTNIVTPVSQIGTTATGTPIVAASSAPVETAVPVVTTPAAGILPVGAPPSLAGAPALLNLHTYKYGPANMPLSGGSGMLGSGLTYWQQCQNLCDQTAGCNSWWTVPLSNGLNCYDQTAANNGGTPAFAGDGYAEDGAWAGIQTN